MSNIKLELISRDRSKETCQKDWRSCYICQVEKKKQKRCRIHFQLVYLLYSFTIFHNLKPTTVLRGEREVKRIMTEFF